MLHAQQLLQKKFNIDFIPPEIVLFFLFLCHLYFAWPGFMTADSIAQYHDAVRGIYTDPSPPLMAFVWRYLDIVHKGSGLMLLLNLLLLYGGVYFLIRSVSTKKIKYLLLLIPLIPNILVYSCYIWKDVAYAFSFLFVNCYLASITLKRKQLSLLSLLLLMPVLFYGTAVKFQAQYLVGFTILWMAIALNNYKINYKMVLKFLVLSGIFYYSLISVNNYLVPHQRKSNYWQLVKIYDIAAISVDSNESLLPDFVKLPKYSEEELHLRFSHMAVDDLVYEPKKGAILHMTQDKIQLEKLLTIWKDSVKSHPFYYLKHRVLNTAYILFDRAGFCDARDYFKNIGIYKYKIPHVIIAILSYILLPHFIPIVLAFFYLGLSIYCLIRSLNPEYAMPLFFFNITAVGMVLLLFIFSMAGIPRYTYISVCMVHASHLFAYGCFKELYQKRARIVKN